MPLTPDPEVVAALMPMLALAGEAPPPVVGDVATRRSNGDALSVYASPARAADLTGLPPTYLEVFAATSAVGQRSRADRICAICAV